MANRRRGPITNRRHLARQERERLQSRTITIISIVLIAVVFLLVVYGLVVSQFVEPTQPVARVNEEQILTNEFRARASYERLLLVSQWNNLANLMLSFGASDPNSASFFVNQMNQIEFQLDPTTVGRSVLNLLIADRLIRAEAAERGIEVTEGEVDEAIQEFFSYFGGEPRPTPTASPTPVATSTLTPLQMTLTAPLATPTLTITDTQSLTESVVLTDTQTITETEVLTPEIAATPVVTITPTPFPTATPLSLDDFQQNYNDYLGTLADLGITEEDFRYLIESNLYRDKVKAVVTADLEPFQDQVWARHILVPTEEDALDVIARLEAGEDFAALAQELSTDQASAAQGGDLGWFGLGTMVLPFEQVAFNQPIGEISDPVQTQFGWHVIQTLGREERALTGAEYEELVDMTFEEWVSQQRLLADVELYDIWVDRVPDEPAVAAGGAQALLQQLQLQAPAP